MQMFFADNVKRPRIPTFQQRPKRINTVGMRLVIHTLTGIMLDLLVVYSRQSLVSLRLIGKNMCTRFRPLVYKISQTFTVNKLRNLSINSVGFTISRSYNRRLAYRTTASIQFLFGMSVSFLASNICLVNLYRSCKKTLFDNPTSPATCGPDATPSST